MKECLENKILEHPILLIAPMDSLSPYEASKDFNQKELKKFTKRYDMLNGSNDVRVLGPKEPRLSFIKGYCEKILYFTDLFEELRPDSVIRIEVFDKADIFAILWPRDTFQVYNDIVVSRRLQENVTYEILSKLNLKFNSINNGGSSPLGEGGCVVRDKDLLFLSELIPAQSNGEISHLEKRGYQIFSLPCPKEEKRGHIDTNINFMFSPDGNPLLCINQGYYSNFQEQIDQIVKKIDARMHIIAEDSVDYRRLAVNFIKLPNGKVMLPDRCSPTQKFLEEGLGKNNVLVAEIDPVVNYSGNGGGLRCMSNLIE